MIEIIVGTMGVLIDILLIEAIIIFGKSIYEDYRIEKELKKYD